MAATGVDAARRSRVVWLAAQLLLGAGLARPGALVVVGVVACLAAIAVAEPAVRPDATAFALLVAVVAVAPVAWPLPALLAGVGLLVLARRRPGGTRDEVPAGPRGSRTWLLGPAAGVLAGVVVAPLVLTAVAAAPMAFPVPQPPVLLLAVLVVGAAVGNALAEELLWRGAVVDVDRRLGITAPATIAVQAAGFGLAHLNGIPGGPVGVLAAGAFGAVMAWLRLRAGLRTALVAHVLTDVVIFSIVAATAVFVPS